MNDIKKSKPATRDFVAKDDSRKPFNKREENFDDFGEDDMGGFDGGERGDKRSFSKRKSDLYIAKKIKPDWKDPNTYSWVVNEFGKIQPARMTGLTPKNHRLAVAAIKRGRAMGLISYLSNYTAR